MKKSIDIFIGGSTDKNISKCYYDTAIELGRKINEREDYKIIFDGCLGLPFLVFNELDDSSKAIIYQTKYYSSNYIHSTGALLCEFKNQSEFISSIPKHSDAMIFMKGTASTVAEILHVIEAKKNKEHDKPIVILNVNSEWDQLVDLLNSFGMNNVYYITDSVIDALNYIEIELFKKSASFYNHYVQYFGRSEPIIENVVQFTK